MRGRVRPHFAVVQLRRQRTWVLPKGKLNRDESALDAARREAIEETGHDVTVHEFLGSVSYKTAGRPKTVRFWRMDASRRPVAKLMRDVRAVRWLPLSQALSLLTHERERLFLQKVGPRAARQAALSKAGRKTATRKKAKAAAKRPARGAGVPLKREPVARARKRQEPAPKRGVRTVPSARGQKRRPQPGASVRKLWTRLRR